MNKENGYEKENHQFHIVHDDVQYGIYFLQSSEEP